MTSAAITCDHPAFQEIETKLKSAVEKIKAAGKATRHDRTQWHQLLAHAEKLITNFSKRAKAAIESTIEEFKELLKALRESRRQPRNIRSRPCVAR